MRGYSVVRQFVGHGVGKQMHEDPQVPNFGTKDSGKRLKAGLVIAVEPMVNAGSPDVEVLDDKWTAVTKDRSMSAHFEHTIAVTEEGPWVLTRPSSSPGKP
jgi:methionyl aminopeptidase